MRKSKHVPARSSEASAPTPLTEAQLTIFWGWVVANSEAAKSMARKVVAAQEADDLVSSATVRFLESFERPEKPAKFPETEAEFMSLFTTIIANRAVDCVREGHVATRPVHSQWGVEYEPIVGGRKNDDRPLDRVFARNDEENYDAPAAAPTRDQDDVDQLDRILRAQIDALPRMQRLVIMETFYEGRKRAEVAARHGIRPKTYDNHLQAAFERLRDDLWFTAFNEWDADRSAWYDRIEELSDRYDNALGRRLAQQLMQGITPRHPLFKSVRDEDKQSVTGAA